MKASKEEEEEEESADEEEAEAEEEDDEEEESFFEKMKAAKKKAKKDSIDPDDLLERLDAIEAENEILAAIVNQDSEEEDDDDDADELEELEDRDDSDDVDTMTPQEIALQLIGQYELAKPFLRTDSTVADFSDVYEIYESAIANRYPEAFEADENGQLIDPSNTAELVGAYKMLLLADTPSRRDSAVNMDSVDRHFAESLGLRTDSAVSTPKTRELTSYY